MEALLSLHSSLFVQRSQWAMLIRSGIDTFLENEKDSGFIKSYFIEFNYSRGENIRLTLFVDSINVESVANKVQICFKSHLSNMKSFPAFQPNGNCLFAPFLSNTIQFGVYTLDETYNYSFIGEFKLRQSISSLIRSVLIEEVSDELIISIGFYVNIILLEVIASRVEYLTQAGEYFLDIVEKKWVFGDADLEFANTEFNKNKEMLAETYQELHNHCESNLTPAFIDLYISFKSLVEALDTCNVNESEDKVCYMLLFSLNSVIAKHFGLEGNMFYMVHYFIYRTVFDSQCTK